MKTLLATILASVLLASAASSVALAQQAGPHRGLLKARGHVLADGRGRGIASGPATGGSVGGISSRD